MKTTLHNTGTRRLLIPFLCLLFLWLGSNCVSAAPSNLRALQENARAYWKKGTLIQYSIPNRLKESDYFTPESVTKKRVKYTDCSGFMRALYMETFGIELPKRTWNLESYIRKNKKTPYVPDYMDQGTYTNYLKKNTLVRQIMKKIRPGDLILLRFDKKNPKGHVVMAYSWIYGKNKKPKDMWVIHSTGKNSSYEKWKSSYNKNFTEGSIRITRLSSLIGDKNVYSKLESDKKSYVFFYGVIRPLATPGTWLSSKGTKVSYRITQRTLSRIGKTGHSKK